MLRIAATMCAPIAARPSNRPSDRLRAYELLRQDFRSNVKPEQGRRLPD